MKSLTSILSLILLIQEEPSIINAFATPKLLLSNHASSSTASTIVLHSSSSSSSSTTTTTAEEEITIDQYSRCLSPYEERQSIKNETSQYSIIDTQPKWQRIMLKPIKLVGRATNKVGRTLSNVLSPVSGSEGEGRSVQKKKPGQLILMRCGESEWTKSGRFTGWADPDLVKEGVLEIEHAAR